MSDRSQKLSLEVRLAVNPNMVFREEGDDNAILFDPDSYVIRVLNYTATAIWKLINGKRRLLDIVEILRDRFVEMDAGAEDQILSYVEDLYRVGALGTEARLSKPAK